MLWLLSVLCVCCALCLCVGLSAPLSPTAVVCDAACFPVLRCVLAVGDGGSADSVIHTHSSSSSSSSSHSMMNGTSDDATDTPSNHLELFVRAGKDGESFGGCPVCQRIFMVLLAKADGGALTFTVTTVNVARPPPEFRRVASRLPAVLHGAEVLTDPDEMAAYVDTHFPIPPLAADSYAATDACRDVFSRFSFFIKDVSHSSAPLLAELARLDAFLAAAGTRFLCADSPSHLDCLVLPKLQHIRVACGALKGLDIPCHLVALWRYLAAAYDSELFRRTCPADAEILYHWLSKPELAGLGKQREHALLIDDTTPVFSFSVPDGVPDSVITQ